MLIQRACIDSVVNKTAKNPETPSLTMLNHIMGSIRGHDTPVEVELIQKSSLLEHLGFSQGLEFGLVLAISKTPSL